MQWIEDYYNNIYVSRAYRLCQLLFKSRFWDIAFKRKIWKINIQLVYALFWSFTHSKPRNLKKAGVLLTHQSISTHIFIPFLLELEVRDVSVIAFLDFLFFPVTPVTFNLHVTEALFFCLLGFSLAFAGSSKTASVSLIKNCILFKQHLTIAFNFNSMGCVWICPDRVCSSFSNTSLM